ncbi:MAG: alpha/beta hydrolase family protein [Planctomycetaceae bacterium]
MKRFVNSVAVAAGLIASQTAAAPAAAYAKDEVAATFEGPAWLEASLRQMTQPPANRLRVIAGHVMTRPDVAVGKVQVAYSYVDSQGQKTPANALLFVPAEAPAGKLPLIYSGGYQLDDETAVGWVRRGYAVATPAGLDRLPLARTANPDTALLHIVRALAFIDDARVIVTGTSAGGWMALMLAAETFPLAGVAPDVPPMNWGYNAAYLVLQKDRLTPAVPTLYGIRPFVEPCLEVYGGDPNDETWFRHSPLAHVTTITCPVSVFWTTADVLVPMNQIGNRWVQPFDKDAFPPGLTMDPQMLMNSDLGRVRLTDALAESNYEIFVVPTPEGAVKRNVSDAPEGRKFIDLPVSATKQWSITIVDEGAPEPQVDHLKYNWRWTRDDFLKRHVTGRIAPDQLTPAKLERLMDRYAGREWLPNRLKSLDAVDFERADVLRGLTTYVSASAENAREFAEQYAKLPAERRVLPEPALRQLAAADLPAAGAPNAADVTAALDKQPISYESDGLKITGLISKPAGKGPFPLILVNHGGFEPAKSVSGMMDLFVRQGFVALASDYRGCGQSEGQREVAKGEVRDILNAVKYAKTLPYVDGERVLMWGFSHGGVLSLLAAARDANLRGIIVLQAPTELADCYRFWAGYQTPPQGVAPLLGLPLIIGGTPDTAPDAWKERSPLYVAEKVTCPVLLIYSDADVAVPADQGPRMEVALRNGGNRNVQLIMVKGANHGLDQKSWAEVGKSMIDFAKGCVVPPVAR